MLILHKNYVKKTRDKSKYQKDNNVSSSIRNEGNEAI